MAEQYELTINIGEDGGEDGYNNSFAPSAPTGSNGTDTSNKGVFKTMAQAWSGAALVKQVFNWQISLIGRNTGNSDLQDKINAGMELGGQALGIIGAFGIGGPVAGFTAMAAVGLSYAQKLEQYNYEKHWENISLQGSRRRAGPSYNRSRRDT